jgi:hypothetical protein
MEIFIIMYLTLFVLKASFDRYLDKIEVSFFMNISITLPKPHEKQNEVLSSTSRRKVLCAGRRAGKTTIIASYSVQQFLAGHRIIYGTPVSKQLSQYWGKIKEYLKPLIKAGYIYKNETEKYIKWMHQKDQDSGAIISAQTAYDADTWRGGWGDILIFDEYAFMNSNIWDIVGAPMMLDTNGEAWFISTPNRKNHFHSLYVRGLDDEDKRYESFKFTSHDNPYLSKEALKEISEDMTKDDYDQEIMALFLDNEGAVFRNIAACMNAPKPSPEKHKGHTLVAGVDWGKHKDYTVISVGCLDCGHEVDLDRFNKIDYRFQRDKLKKMFEKWGMASGLIELNSIGEPNFEMLEDEGLPVEGFNTTYQSKKRVIENLALVLQDEEMQYLDISIATAEMEAYEIQFTKAGRVTYGAPEGVHDDTVIARALMTHSITSYMPAFL